MQIHELTTKPKLDEGVIDDVKAGYRALKQPGGLKALGKGIASLGFARGDWDERVSAAANQPRLQNLAKTMAAQWTSLADQIEQTAAPAPAPAQSTAPSKPTLKQKIQQQAQTTATGGATISTVKPAPSPGAPTAAEREKFEKQVAAAATKTPVSEVVAQKGAWTDDQYRQRFVQWFDSMMSQAQISLDDLTAGLPQIKSQLTAMVDEIVRLRNTKEQAAKVAELMEKGLAASAVLRQQQRVQGTAPQAQQQPANLTQQAPALLAQLAKSGPIKSTGNPAVDQILKSLGFQI